MAPADYLKPDCTSQQAVRAAVLEMTGLEPDQLGVAVDGCSAPTFRMPLQALATAFARVMRPAAFGATRTATCERLVHAARQHPGHIAGRHKRICTTILEASGGRLFPKLGAEAVYAVGDSRSGEAFAVKRDDGGLRGLHAVVVELLRRFDWLDTAGLRALDGYREAILKNAAGLEVGFLEVEL
ncbi:MAG: asparaginase [Planctomycetota bacterium]